MLVLAGHEAEVSSVYSLLSGPGASLLAPLGPRSCPEAGVPLAYCSCPQGHVTLQAGQVEGVARAALHDINIYLQPLWGCRQLELERVTDVVMKTEGNETLLEAVVTVTARPAKFQLRTSYSAARTTGQLTRMDHYSDTAMCVPQEEARARPHCVCPANN